LWLIKKLKTVRGVAAAIAVEAVAVDCGCGLFVYEQNHKTHQNNVNSLSGSNLLERPSVGYKNFTHIKAAAIAVATVATKSSSSKGPQGAEVPVAVGENVGALG